MAGGKDAGKERYSFFALLMIDENELWLKSTKVCQLSIFKPSTAKSFVDFGSLVPPVITAHSIFVSLLGLCQTFSDILQIDFGRLLYSSN